MNLPELIGRVNSRETFLEFVAALREDLQASNRQETIEPSCADSLNSAGWENPTLESYIEALHSWTEDMGGRIAEPPSWRTFADILYAAKIYE